jgi:lipopolysaccharide/colanic/teichoic acid biosynthesis glycosyltransferase
MFFFIKRLIDIFIAILTLFICLPLIVPVVISLSLTGEREIFYFQKRVGYKKKYFNIWKFATMVKNSPNMVNGEITLRNDPRVTIIGKYLRMTKLNEFPQFINVIKGEMSIVGPRPLVDSTFNAYPVEIQNKIMDVKPGITGLGSIIFRDEEKLISQSNLPPLEFYTKYIAPYKGEVELWYHKHHSFYTDFMILFITAWVILFPSSNLLYSVFKDLPKKPAALIIA